jgi:hypothetical protein
MPSSHAPIPQNLLARPAVALLALCVALPACARLGGQTTSKDSTGAIRAADPIDVTLDRVDAARRRLVAIDAAEASAQAQLDSALDEAARLTGHPREEMALQTIRPARERDPEDWGEDVGRHWSRVGQRLAVAAERMARRQAELAQREVQRALDRSDGFQFNWDDHSWNDRPRISHSWSNHPWNDHTDRSWKSRDKDERDCPCHDHDHEDADSDSDN